MINTLEITKAFINSHYGWAVAEQFESTFEDSSIQNMEEQNLNALKYIAESVEELIDSNIYNDDVERELKEYLDDLNIFLNN